MNNCYATIYAILLTIQSAYSDKTPIQIGGIFSDQNYEVEIAFRHVIERENIYNKNLEFIPIVVKLDDLSNSYKVERLVCNLLSEGVVAIFGPSSSVSSGITAAICQTYQIPHFQMEWQSSDDRTKTLFPEIERHTFTRNLFPDADLYSRALADTLVNFGWNSYTILYDSMDGIERLLSILELHEPDSNPITVRNLNDGLKFSGIDQDYRPLLKEIKNSAEVNLILDCKVENIITILRQCKEVGILEDYANVLITTIDAHTVDYAELKQTTANISTVRIMDPKSFDVTTAIHDWREMDRRQNGTYIFNEEHIRTETALTHDALHLFLSAVKELNSIEQIVPVIFKCHTRNDDVWTQGESILKYMDQKTEYGMSGRILFHDEKRTRTDFYMELLQLMPDGMSKFGYWDSAANAIISTRDFSEVYSRLTQSLQNKTFIVASREGMPFLRKKIPAEGEVLEGNDRYEGYSVDLIDGIAKILGFKYRFELEPNNKYGSFNKVTKQWDGLVKQLLDRKADLAICDLTITYERRTAVDFTMPFMTLGISILFAKPVKQPPELFSFLSPLSIDVWIYTGTAYMGVTLLLLILARAAPDDWESSHPCDQEPEEVENIWDIPNCTWLTIGSIMAQGCDLLPKAISTRLVAGMWWFFALIMLSSYTANLAAFLTMERMDVSIESAEDLAKQSKIKYGAVLGGSTLSFFKQSNFSLYQRMWSAMESAEPSVFVANNKEGEDRVAKSQRLYAFFMESSSLEYIVERNCNLTQVGGLLDSKGYGIAMPQNSPYRTFISQTVLKMQEDGKLHQLKIKWWKERDGGGNCEADEGGGSADAAELGIGNVGGVFVVLVLGCTCAFIIGVLEFLWNIKKVAIDEKVSPVNVLKMELLFALDVTQTTKPVFKEMAEDSESKGSSGKSSRKSSTKSMSK